MVTNLKICKSIIKKNKSFSIGLLIMSILTMAIGFLGFNIGHTSKDSIGDFIKTANLPDTLYTTEFMSAQSVESIKSLEGVKSFESRFVYESKFELKEDEIYPARVFTYDKSGNYQIVSIKEIKEDSDLVKAYIPIRFARAHKIVPGDKLEINSPFGPINSIVKGLVASADGFFPSKDFMSNQEGYSYCYIYLDQNDFAKTYDISNFANQFLLYFEEDISTTQRNEILQKIDDLFLNKLISKKSFEKSKNNLLSFSDDIDSISTIAEFFAILILVITLAFNFIFIQIIVKKESKTIGLLRALGYSKFKVVGLFCLYTVLINLVATIIGLPIGYGLLLLGAYAMSFNQGIPYNVITISPYFIILTVVLTFLAGIISAILSSIAISKIDPSEAYGKKVNYSNEPIKALSHIRNNEFLKISLGSILRNVARQIVASLSITACITFMFVGFEGFATTSNLTKSVYGKRFLYDINVRNINDEDYLKITNEIDGIEIIEPNINFESQINDDYICINALKDNYQLVKLYNSKKQLIYPKDGIIIDEITAKDNHLHVGDYVDINGYSLQIDGVARELIAHVSYVSFQTAQNMGKAEINGAMVKVKDSTQINKILKDISNLDESYYLVRNSDQRSYLDDLYIQIKISLAMFASIAFVIGTLLIANMSFIDFLETKNKYATLLALGYTPAKLTKINIIQNLFRVLIGAIIALPLSYLVGYLLTSVLSTNGIQFIFVKFVPIYLICVAIALIYILVGALISYRHIKRLNIVNHLNNGE